jgi:hypothetical protein
LGDIAASSDKREWLQDQFRAQGGLALGRSIHPSYHSWTKPWPTALGESQMSATLRGDYGIRIVRDLILWW